MRDLKHLIRIIERSHIYIYSHYYIIVFYVYICTAIVTIIDIVSF